MEEQLNKEAKEGWRFAADAARITDERASSKDQKAHIRRCFGGRWTAIWEQLLEEKREQLRPSQELKEELSRYG